MGGEEQISLIGGERRVDAILRHRDIGDRWLIIDFKYKPSEGPDNPDDRLQVAGYATLREVQRQYKTFG